MSSTTKGASAVPARNSSLIQVIRMVPWRSPASVVSIFDGRPRREVYGRMQSASESANTCTSEPRTEGGLQHRAYATRRRHDSQAVASTSAVFSITWRCRNGYTACLHSEVNEADARISARALVGKRCRGSLSSSPSDLRRVRLSNGSCNKSRHESVIKAGNTVPYPHSTPCLRPNEWNQQNCRRRTHLSTRLCATFFQPRIRILKRHVCAPANISP